MKEEAAAAAAAADEEACGEEVAGEESAAEESAAMETTEDKRRRPRKTKRYDEHAMFCARPPANLLSFAFSICRI